jgi:hypothetical protein
MLRGGARVLMVEPDPVEVEATLLADGYGCLACGVGRLRPWGFARRRRLRDRGREVDLRPRRSRCVSCLEWRDIYTRLATEPDDGIAGALCARAEAHVLRLAMLYALLDGQPTIRTAHLRSGLALWDYAARSAAWATGGATGDPLAEQIHAALTASADGLTRTQLRDLFSRNQPAARVDAALTALAHTGRAQRHRQHTAGRPAEIWAATNPPTV